jgi:tRNA(fMet)-specific endonuclease VapC
MAMKRLLLDTNGYSLAMRGDSHTVEILQRTDHIGLSVISLGELLSGFALGGREPKNRAELEEFLDSPRVCLYAIDETTADFYAQPMTSGSPPSVSNTA